MPRAVDETRLCCFLSVAFGAPLTARQRPLVEVHAGGIGEARALRVFQIEDQHRRAARACTMVSTRAATSGWSGSSEA